MTPSNDELSGYGQIPLHIHKIGHFESKNKLFDKRYQ